MTNLRMVLALGWLCVLCFSVEAAPEPISLDFYWPGQVPKPGSFEESLLDQLFPLTRECFQETKTYTGPFYFGGIEFVY